MSFVTEFNHAFGYNFSQYEEENLRKIYFSCPGIGVIWARQMAGSGEHVTESEWLRACLSATFIGYAVIIPLDLFATVVTQPNWGTSEKRRHYEMIGKGR